MVNRNLAFVKQGNPGPIQPPSSLHVAIWLQSLPTPVGSIPLLPLPFHGLSPLSCSLALCWPDSLTCIIKSSCSFVGSSCSWGKTSVLVMSSLITRTWAQALAWRETYNPAHWFHFNSCPLAPYGYLCPLVILLLFPHSHCHRWWFIPSQSSWNRQFLHPYSLSQWSCLLCPSGEEAIRREHPKLPTHRSHLLLCHALCLPCPPALRFCASPWDQPRHLSPRLHSLLPIQEYCSYISPLPLVRYWFFHFI